jgi:aminomethyltransferase
VKKTPFHDAGLALGAKMVELFGYYLPWEYSAGHEKEHLGTRNAASLCDLDYMGEFIIEGADALAFVQKLATNDYSKKTAGSVQYTAMCDAQGNMIDDGTIWSLGEHKFMVVSGAESDFDWIKSNAGGFNITLKNITSEHTTLALQGPKSTHVMRKLTNFDLESLGYYRFIETKVADAMRFIVIQNMGAMFGTKSCRPAPTLGSYPAVRPHLRVCARRPAISWLAMTTIGVPIRLRPGSVSR